MVDEQGSEKQASERAPFEPEMMLIPAGQFFMGVDPEEDVFDDSAEPEGETAIEEQAYAAGWHGPPHAVTLPDYYIARTPATNGQYAAFLQETDHPLPKRWRSRKSPRGKEAFPIVYVSWHDALAYCRWLAEVTGKPYRLPSEAEWEKAASWEDHAWEITELGPQKIGEPGGQKRRYPWGNRFDPKRCNTMESETDKITPVDAYAQGSSPYRLLDMAGNTWEWTCSLWGKGWYTPEFGYPYNPSDGREDQEAPDDFCRVLRGGSYAYDRRFARSAYRYKNFPQNHSDGLGFRVALDAAQPESAKGNGAG